MIIYGHLIYYSEIETQIDIISHCSCNLATDNYRCI